MLGEFREVGAGGLARRQRRDEEPRVEALGLDRRRDPVRPVDELPRCRGSRSSSSSMRVNARGIAGHRRRAARRAARRVAAPQGSPDARAGEQHARFLEGLAAGGDVQAGGASCRSDRRRPASTAACPSPAPRASGRTRASAAGDWSAASMRPPGNTHMPPMKDRPAPRRIMSASSLPSVSRSRTHASRPRCIRRASRAACRSSCRAACR